MGKQSLSSLVVDLQLETAQLRKGLDDAKQRLEAFHTTTKGIGRLISEVFAFEMVTEAAKRLGDFVKSGAEAADKMGKLAAAAGVPVEAFSRLTYAAGLADVSADELGNAVMRLSRNLMEAAGGGKEQAALFQALGINIRDASGHLKDGGTVLAEVAERFSGLKDGSAKTALAMELFGKTGARLIPMLNDGAAGLAALGAEAARTGNVISAQGAASAAEFNDALTRLQKVGEGLAIRVAEELTPSLAAMSTQLVGSATDAGRLNGAAGTLANTVRVLASGGAIVATVFEVVGTSIAGAAAAVAAFVDAMGKSFTQKTAFDPAAVKAAREEVTRLKAELQSAGESWASATSGGDQAKQMLRIQELRRELAAAQEDLAKKEAAPKQQVAVLGGLLETTKAIADEAGAAFDRLADRQKAIWTPPADAQAKTQEAVKASGDAILANIEQVKAARAAADAAAKKGREEAARAAKKEEEFQRAAAQAAFELTRQQQGINRDVGRRAQAFANVGASPGDILAQQTAGFSNFKQALQTYATALQQEAAQRSEAQLLKLRGDDIGARNAEASADAFRDVADRAGEASEAFAEMSRAADAAARGMAEKLMGGRLTGLVRAGSEGAALGGPGGALLGVGVELLSQSAQFSRAMEMVDQLLQTLADTVGRLIEPLLPIIALFGTMVDIVTGLWGGMEALTPVFEGLFNALKFVFTKVLEFQKGILDFWNSIADGLGQDWMRADTSGIEGALDRLSGVTFETAEATYRMGRAAEQATEALLNAPQGFKTLALARYRAIEGESTPPWLGGGAPPASSGGSSTPGGAGSGGAAAPVVEVNVGVDMARYIRVESRVRRYGETGTSLESAAALSY